MKPRLSLRAAVVLITSTLALSNLRAADATTPQPLMTEPAAALTSDSFATALPKGWRPGKGTWTVADGVLRGLEVKADAHQAVIRRALAFTNAIFKFSFRLGQARQISLSINDAKEHVCRLIINAHGFTVQKDDHDHDGPDKPVVFARMVMPLRPDEWHTTVVEINGAEMVAQIDDAKHIGFGAHELIHHPKANFGLTVAGGPADFRDIAVMGAKPRADWAETKKRLGGK